MVLQSPETPSNPQTHENPSKVQHGCPPVWKRMGISCSFCPFRVYGLGFRELSAKAERFSRWCPNAEPLDANVRVAWLRAIAEHLAKLDAVIDKFN